MSYGGALYQEYDCFTRSGGGAYWDQGYPFHFSVPLWCQCQGLDRAEQYMALAVLEVCP